MEKSILRSLIKTQGPLKGAVIDKCIQIGGSSQHRAWRLTLEDDKELFLKIGAKEILPIFKYEKEGLESIKKFANRSYLSIPNALQVELVENSAIIVFPWLILKSGNQSLLGQGLALMHKASATQQIRQYGWNQQGYIGLGDQPGGWEKYWGDCFIDLRLKPQLTLAKKWGLNYLELENTLTIIRNFLNNYNPQPCLVHGDLWSGNTAVGEDGKGIIFDPATWWADREVDIAMTRLFGGFSNEFYKSYNDTWPLEVGFEKRVNIYNLYHVLNHANIFGGQYISQSISLIKEISKNIYKDLL